MMNVVSLEKLLHALGFELRALIGLKLHGLATLAKYCFKCRLDMLRALGSQRLCPSIPAEQVNDCQNILETLILHSLLLHVHQVRLPLVVDTARIIFACLVSCFASQFVKSVCLLSFQPFVCTFALTPAARESLA